VSATNASMLRSEWSGRLPYHEKLQHLLKTGDPGIGYFTVTMKRHEVQNLRKALFGPKGSRDAPKGAGTRMLVHPNGWRVQLNYAERGRTFSDAGEAIAQFIPPASGEEHGPRQRAAGE
jgi:hypothetical protein